MLSIYNLYQQPLWFISILLVLAIWEMIWKGISLWHSAKNKQKAWFIVIFIINTMGILPIIYLLWFKPKEENSTLIEVSPKAPAHKAKRRKKK